jgi:hypothetical protein
MMSRFKIGPLGALAVSEERKYVITETRVSIQGVVMGFLRSGIFPKKED